MVAPKQMSRSTSAASRYMQKLYFKHAQNPGPYEGSTVRSISPQLITSGRSLCKNSRFLQILLSELLLNSIFKCLELENVDDMSQLVFNLGAIHPNEKVTKFNSISMI